MDKTIFTSPGNFLIVKSAETTPYFYTERKGIDSVAFILMDRNNPKRYGVVNERKPPLDERFGGIAFLETAFGGSNDIIDNAEYLNMSSDQIIEHMTEIVKIEAREEAGFDVDYNRIIFVSQELVSTQMNQWCYLFIVDVTDIEQGETDPQNETEAMASIVWKNFKEVKEMYDWKAKSIIFNFMAFLIGERKN